MPKTPICIACGQEVIFNLHIWDLTGMCGTCTTGEARLNYEEETDEKETNKKRPQ